MRIRHVHQFEERAIGIYWRPARKEDRRWQGLLFFMGPRGGFCLIFRPRRPEVKPKDLLGLYVEREPEDDLGHDPFADIRREDSNRAKIRPGSKNDILKHRPPLDD